MAKNDAQVDLKAEGRLQRFLRVVTCRRRAPVAAGGLPEGYRELVATAKGLSKDECAAFAKMAYWSDAETKQSARCFVLAPCDASGDFGVYVDMVKLLAFCVSKMHDHVSIQDKEYAVVWLQYSDHRVGKRMLWKFKQSLPERYSQNLEAIHVVHPSWSVRTIRFFAWPFVQEPFWDMFQSHERIEFLDKYVKSVKKLQLEQRLYQYDKFLDAQAEEICLEANKQMGHRLGNTDAGDPNDPDSRAYKEQVAEIQKLIKSQGIDVKMD